MIALQSPRSVPALQPIRVPDGCTVFYDFSADTGPGIIDRSGNGHHGAVTGAIVRPGPTGMVRSFDGIDDTVSSIDTVPFLASAWTVAAWVLLTDPGTFCSIAGFNYCLHPEIACEAGDVAVYYSDTLVALTSGTPFATFTNKWMHMAITYDLASRHQVFVNGQPATLAVNDAASYLSESVGFYVSRVDSSVTGLIGEVFTANRAMSAPEVESCHRETAWRYVGW